MIDHVKKYNRKEFLSFLGKVSLGAVIVPPYLEACGNISTPNIKAGLSNEQLKKLNDFVLEGLMPSDKDDLLLAKGLDYHIIARWNDNISDTDTFGFNCDFTCFIPLDDTNPSDGLLWVNHEYINPLFVSAYNKRNKAQRRTQEQVAKEMYNVGGSIVRIRQENGTWKVVPNDRYNRRITGNTPIKLN